MFKYIFLAAVLAATCSSLEISPNPLCQQRNVYLAVEGNCDAYIECKDYVPSEMLCPDGLHFNPEAHWPAYPCGYPMDVPCKGRGAAQPAKPTAECPHQYGFYPSPQASASNCGQYRMCIEGKATEMLCPPGLAFNPDTAQCDWPELVPSCNADSFLGFKCPPAPLDQFGQPIDTVINYPYEGNCYAFFSCHDGHARLLTCDAGYAFDPLTGHCENADRVLCDAKPVLVTA